MNQKPLFLAVTLIALLAIGGVFWMMQNQTVIQTTVSDDETNPVVEKDEDAAPLEPSKDYAIRPDFLKVKDFKNTLTLQKGVTVKYGNGWVGKRMENPDNVVSGQLVKTVGGRSYVISMFEINHPTTDISDTKVYAVFDINKNPHSINITSISSTDGIHEYASVSSCSEQAKKDCSLTLEKDYLNMMLGQYVLNAQESVSLNFSRLDDQQILAEFTEIASTLKY